MKTDTNTPASNEMPAHTPTPWQLTHRPASNAGVWEITGPAGHHIAAIRGDRAASHFKAEEANAAHIVRCVNAHDALTAEVARLRALLDASPALRRMLGK